MTKLHYSYHYVSTKRSGLHGARYAPRQVFNAALPSTYSEVYSFRRPRSKFRFLFVGICLMAVVGYVTVMEFGLFDNLYLWLTN